MDNKKKALFNYLKPSPTLPVIYLCAGIIFLIRAVCMGIFGNGESIIRIIMVCVVGMIFIAVFGAYSFSTSAIKRLINDVEDKGYLPQLLNDFETGGKAFNDTLRLGQMFLIGKGTGSIVSYRKIKRIYQSLHKVNSPKEKPSLMIEVENNLTFALCEIPQKGQANDEVSQVLAYIKNMNNDIQIG